MKTNTLFFILPILMLSACCNNDDNIPVENFTGISSYKFYYMDYPSGTRIEPDSNVEVIYNGDRIVRLNGGFLQIDQASGYDYIFDKRNHREISYEANTATITDRVSTGVSTGYNQIVEFANDGKLTRRIRLTPDHINFRDTINYYYVNNVLKSFERRSIRLVERSEIFYNDVADADSIVTRYPTYTGPGQYHFDPESQDRKVVYFENFDGQSNPFQKFVLFEDTFNRSLSAHNYSKIRTVKYDYDGHTIGDTFMEWTFIRENGIINFAL